MYAIVFCFIFAFSLTDAAPFNRTRQDFDYQVTHFSYRPSRFLRFFAYILLRNFTFVKDEPLLKENVKRWMLENQADTQMLENDKVEEFFQELGFRYLCTISH